MKKSEKTSLLYLISFLSPSVLDYSWSLMCPPRNKGLFETIVLDWIMMIWWKEKYIAKSQALFACVSNFTVFKWLQLWYNLFYCPLTLPRNNCNDSRLNLQWLIFFWNSICRYGGSWLFGTKLFQSYPQMSKKLPGRNPFWQKRLFFFISYRYYLVFNVYASIFIEQYDVKGEANR